GARPTPAADRGRARPLPRPLNPRARGRAHEGAPMSAPTPAAIPHRLRLWAILIATLLDVAALIALRLDVAPELIGEIRPLVDSALYAVLGLLVLGLGDAYMVERRRRTPGIPALPDDDQVGNGGSHIVAPLPWPPPPTPPDPP